MHLTIGNVTYEGPTSMIQYVVQSTKMVLKDSKYLVVEISLKRMFKYHLAATFVPTTLLMIVTQLTLFVDEKHFDATIMVHLTTMLVMYTLYQGVSASMPKTADLKFIDIWLLYGLIIPFVTFVVETLLRLLSERNGTEIKNDDGEQVVVKSNPSTRTIRVTPINENKSMSEGSMKSNTIRMKTKWFLQYAAQIMIPSVTFFFIVTYMYLAFTYYNE